MGLSVVVVVPLEEVLQKLRVTLRRKTYLVLQLIVEVSNLTLCLFHLFL